MLGREHLARFGFRLVMVELVEEDAHDRKPMETSPIQPLPYMGSETGRTHCLQGISALDCMPSVSVLVKVRAAKHADGWHVND